MQHWVASPGIYDRLIVVASYPDAWSTMLEIEDCSLLRGYFSDPTRWAPAVSWNAEQQAAVAGHASNLTCAWVGPTGTAGFANLFNPSVGGGLSCVGVPPAQIYHPQTNPNGVRCTLQDDTVSIVGRRADGFANRSLDNVGIPYGLRGVAVGRDQRSAVRRPERQDRLGPR